LYVKDLFVNRSGFVDIAQNGFQGIFGRFVVANYHKKASWVRGMCIKGWRIKRGTYHKYSQQQYPMPEKN
jgi:hypothetical protein